MSAESTTAPTVLLVPPLSRELREEVAAAYRTLELPREGRAEFLARHAAEVTAIVATNTGRVDADLIDALPHLAVIANHGVGYDNIDVARAVARGIAVSNTPGVLDDAVADTAIGLLLAVRSRMLEADRYVRDGRWGEGGAFPLTVQVSGSAVGIVGLGRIGRTIADRLAAFGCRVSYHNRRRVDGLAYPYAASVVELASAVDNLIVVVPGSPATDHLIDGTVLDALGPDGVLVNVARGSVVDEEALTDRLLDGRVAGAGLDVFAAEPHVPRRLREAANAVLLPHVGSGTLETRAAMRALVLDNLASWLATGTLVTPVPECADQAPAGTGADSLSGRRGTA